MNVERRVNIRHPLLMSQLSYDRQEDEVSKAKPFVISKGQVMRAFELVKANAGAAGVDKQSLADFERNRTYALTSKQ